MSNLYESIKKINLIYPLIILFLFLFQRLDCLVCGALEKADEMQGTGNAHIMSWWVLMSITVFIVAIMLYASSSIKRQGVWYASLLSLLYVGGFLDIMYVFETPFPAMWASLDFIHYWNIFYILFGVPWNIAYQVVWWIGWIIGIYLLYRFLKSRYGIELMLMK